MFPLLRRGVGCEDLGRGLSRAPPGLLPGGPRGGRVLGSALQLSLRRGQQRGKGARV